MKARIVKKNHTVQLSTAIIMLISDLIPNIKGKADTTVNREEHIIVPEAN